MARSEDLPECDPSESLEECVGRIRSDRAASHELKLIAAIAQKGINRIEAAVARLEAQQVTTDKKLSAHIAQEDPIAESVKEISAKLTRMDTALYGEQLPDGARVGGLVTERHRWRLNGKDVLLLATTMASLATAAKVLGWA